MNCVYKDEETGRCSIEYSIEPIYCRPPFITDKFGKVIKKCIYCPIPTPLELAAMRYK